MFVKGPDQTLRGFLRERRIMCCFIQIIIDPQSLFEYNDLLNSTMDEKFMIFCSKICIL
jgi:hypothetical protein